MKFSAVVGALCAAGFATAAPFTHIRRERNARLLAERQRRGFMIPDTEEGVEAVANGNDTAHVSYSTNWAGAVLIGSGYTSVTGSFVVPTPKVPTGGSAAKQYAASAWVGIDGDTCTTSILQTGIDFFVQEGQVSFGAWYEWFPDYAHDFTTFAVSAGQTITMTVTASSKSTGTAVIKNESTGKSVTHSFTAQTKALCETNAEWIVEDFESGSSLVPFADFGTVTFKNALVNGNKGVTGATIIDLRQSGKVLTSCSASGSQVACTYV